MNWDQTFHILLTWKVNREYFKKWARDGEEDTTQKIFKGNLEFKPLIFWWRLWFSGLLWRFSLRSSTCFLMQNSLNATLSSTTLSGPKNYSNISKFFQFVHSNFKTPYSTQHIYSKLQFYKNEPKIKVQNYCSRF